MPTIKKNNHRPGGLSVGLFFGKRKIKKRVLFHENCRYLLPKEEQTDLNKLFGLGYFWSIHKDSARFAWRYVPEMDRILICAYCYVNGKRIEERLGAVRLNTVYEMALAIQESKYYFYLQNEVNGWHIKEIPFTHRKKFSYPCGLYFGGNLPAPQNITVDIKEA